MKKKDLVILIFIILIGLFLRLYQLDKVSLYGDELTLVYDAYSILKTGYDQNGDFLPLTFRMAEGRPAGYVYFSVPFVAFLGPSVLAARLLSVLSGMGIILLMFYLGKRLINEKVGLAAAALTAISPWGIHLSRAGFETHFALLLTLLGVVLFLAAKTRPKLIIFSALSFALAIHTYSTYKLTVPLIVALLIWLHWGEIKVLEKKHRAFNIIAAFIITAAITLVAFQALTSKTEGRFLTINVFNQTQLKEEITQKINFERSVNNLPSTLSSLFHNKVVEYSLIVGKNYLDNFSLDFLFLHGDKNPRHNPAVMGELYLVEIIFIFFGLIFFMKRKEQIVLLGIWLLIAPLPSSLTGQPHALRGSLMLPPLILFSAAGFVYLWSKTGTSKLISKGKKLCFIWLRVAMILGFLVQFTIFAERYYFLAPQQFGKFWSYSAKLASEMVINNRNNFDYVILSDRLDSIEFAYPVYAQINPSEVIAQNFSKTTLGNYKFKKLDNVYIGSIPENEIEGFINNLDGAVMYVGSPEEAKSLKDYDTVDDKDGTKALVVKKINRQHIRCQ